MSPTQSRRAEGRRRDMRGSALTALRAHDPLVTRLESVAGITDGREAITAAPYADGPVVDDERDVAIGVRIPASSSRSPNFFYEVTFTVETDLQLRDGVFQQKGTAWADGLADEAGSVLTADRNGWYAQGQSGTDDLSWGDSISRWQLTQNYKIMIRTP